MCGIAASCVSWAPQRALKHSDFVMAVGELDSVRVWALSSGNALLSISSLPQSCNCVWLSPDGENLACAGGSGKIMVWKLPEIALVHIFHVRHRVWAIWGTSELLVSAGGDSQVTIHSLETGAVLSRYQRSGNVFALWGSPDGSMLVSGGKAFAFDKHAAAKRPGHHNGSVTVGVLHSTQVLFQFEGLHGGDTKCMWTGSNILAWVTQSMSKPGLEFATVLDVQTGEVIADFALKDAMVKGVHCFCLDSEDSSIGHEGWVIALAFQSRLLVMDIKCGKVLGEWPTPDCINCLGGDDVGKRVVVGGLWDGLMLVHLNHLDAPPMHLNTNVSQCPPLALRPRSSSETEKKGGLRPDRRTVRCIWISENGLLLAYAIEFDCFVRSLSMGDTMSVNDDQVMRLVGSGHSRHKISSVWGSNDCRILVTGHSVSGEAVLWCLMTGRALQKIAGLQGCKSMSGFGCLRDPYKPLTLVFGCEKSRDGVSLWRVRLEEEKLLPGHSTLQATWDHEVQGVKRRIKPGELFVTHMCTFPTIQDVHCVLASRDGSSLFFAGRERNISIYRLDRLKNSGPSLRYLQRSPNAREDIRHHNAALFPLLKDGSLMEWLLQE
jgi:WD40 repeat protein